MIHLGLKERSSDTYFSYKVAAWSNGFWQQILLAHPELFGTAPHFDNTPKRPALFFLYVTSFSDNTLRATSEQIK